MMPALAAWEEEGLYQTETSLNLSLEPQMRRTIIAFAVLNIAVTCVLTLAYRKQEDRVNSFVRNTGRIEEQKNRMAVLSQTEEMMVREEIFLESLASKLARKENAISVDSSEWVPRLKSFLKTFRERPRLQTKGRHCFCYSVHYLCLQELKRCAKNKRKKMGLPGMIFVTSITACDTCRAFVKFCFWNVSFFVLYSVM